MREIYKVTLTLEERQTLIELVSTGKSNTQKIKHANILLVVDESHNETFRKVLKKTNFLCWK